MKKLLLILVLSIGSAQAAPVRYSYQGNSFDQTFTGLSAIDPADYLPSGVSALSGYFTMDEALDADLVEFSLNEFGSDVFVSDWAFSNGAVTMTAEDFFIWDFTVWTDSTGAISNWRIAAYGPLALDPFGPGNNGLVYGFSTDNYSLDESGTQIRQYDDTRYCIGDCTFLVGAYNSGSIGTWSQSVVPIPAAAWLFGSALLGLGWVRKRAALHH